MLNFFFLPILTKSVVKKPICLYEFVGGNWTMVHNGTRQFILMSPNTEKINTKSVDDTGYTPNITEFTGILDENEITVSIKNNFTASVKYGNLQPFNVTFSQTDPSSSHSIVVLPDNTILQFIVPAPDSFELKIIPKEHDQFILYGFHQHHDTPFNIWEIIIPFFLTCVIMYFLKKYHIV